MIKLFVCGDFRAKDSSKVNVTPQLRALISGADYAICNFEAPVESNGKPIKKSGPLLYQDANSPKALKDLGFNVFLLANNHIMDYGKAGCEATIESFKNAITVGAGDAHEAYLMKILEKDGMKIGLLAFVQHEFGVVETPSDSQLYGAAWINTPSISDIIRVGKTQVDYLLVFPHAGVEHTDAPLPEWRRLYKKLIDWGADAVISSHPHCPQGWEKYNNKTIYYSLGNFYFDEIEGGNLWYRSIGIEIEIDTEMILTPHLICFQSDGCIMIDNRDDSVVHIKYINQLLNEENKYKIYIDTICKKHYQNYKYGILRGVCGFTWHIKLYYALRLFTLMILGNKDEMYLLNSYQNESHRWLIERSLNLNNYNNE